MVKEIENFKRVDLFNYYHQCDNPFIIVTTKVNVTNVVEYCKEHKHFYPTMGYLITKTANQIDAFKYRYKDGKFYYCDEIKSNYTLMYDDGNIGFVTLPIIHDFHCYIQKFIEVQQQEKSDVENGLDEIWFSCVPWFSFSGLITPFNKKTLIPQFIWDKYEFVNGNYYVNLMIMIHHGFADGSHIGKFINSLEENIKSFK